MLREDAADSEAVAVHIFPICAAIRVTSVAMLPSVSVGVPACAKIALVGHEDRLEGEGRWLVGGALAGGRGHSGAGVPLFCPHPVAFLLLSSTVGYLRLLL